MSTPPAALPQPTEPLDVDGVAAMTAGTIAWTAALVVLLLTGTTFESDNAWWLWTCLSGIVIGALGVAFTRRRRAAYQGARAG